MRLKRSLMFCKTERQLSTLHFILLIFVILCTVLFCAVFLTLTDTKLQTAEAAADITDKTVVITAKYDDSVVNMDFKPYEKFDEAWKDIMGTESISDGHFRYEVILLNNCELPETLTLMVHSIDLYLNGYKLSLSASTGSVFKVVDGGTLRIHDDTADSQFKQAYPDSYPYEKGEHSVTSPVTGETVTVNGGLITGGKGSDYESIYGPATVGGAVFMGEKAGEFMMFDGTIAGNTADYGGGIYITAGGLISGGSITHNKAYLAGGGMFVRYCEGTICNQNADMTISNNEAADGGGIYFSEIFDKSWSISGATIENNRAVKGPENVEFSGKGGGIYLNYCPVSFESGVIRNNTAYDYGGGVYVQDTSAFTISGGTIENNTVENGNTYVGGVYNNRGTINVEGAPQFVNNALYLELDMDYKKINVTAR